LFAVRHLPLQCWASGTTRERERTEAKFRNAVIELGLLTLMVVALVVSLMLLRKAGAKISSK